MPCRLRGPRNRSACYSAVAEVRAAEQLQAPPVVTVANLCGIGRDLDDARR